MAVAGWIATRTDNRQRFGMVLMVASAILTVISVHPHHHQLDRRIGVAVLFGVTEVAMFFHRTVRRDRALVLLCVGVAGGIGALLLAPNGLAEVPVLAPMASIPNVAEGRVRQVAVAVCSVAFGVALAVAVGSPVGLLAGAGGWFLADRTAEQAKLVKERDRAVALLAEVEASRVEATERAASDERRRIAREMHDVLAHSLAGLSLQLQAVRALAARHGVPAEVTEPLDKAAELAREGVNEAKAVVSALRPSEGLGLDAVGTLVDRFPGQAHLDVIGDPGQVEPAAGHAVYRAVQESLTNTARYAPGASVIVRLTWGPHLAVRITDGGRPPGREPSGVKGSGAGLAGMTERLSAVGGTLQAGPHGSGWCVELTVPSTEAPAPAAATNGEAP